MAYYKYRKIVDNEYFSSILINEQLFCSPYDKLNDPSEWYFESKERFDQKFLDEHKNVYRICCLSATYWNNLMWCLYANDHQGCCIEVEIDESKIEKGPLQTIKVNYSQEVMRHDNLLTVSDVLQHKTLDWEHEEETRFVLPQASNGNNKDTFLPVKITSIILGCRITDEAKSIIKKHIKRDIPVYQMKRNVFSYITNNTSEVVLKRCLNCDSLLERIEL